jgi:hypothetical protein
MRLLLESGELDRRQPLPPIWLLIRSNRVVRYIRRQNSAKFIFRAGCNLPRPANEPMAATA